MTAHDNQACLEKLCLNVLSNKENMGLKYELNKTLMFEK